MKMKRLLVTLSLLAIAHMIMMASGSAVWDEIFKDPSNRPEFYLSTSLFIVSVASVLYLYIKLYAKTRKK